jgi:hypothetical protein
MLRFKVRESAPGAMVVWPDFKPGPDSTPFSPRPPLRQLVVAVDADVLAEAKGGALTPVTLLCGLLTHPHFRLLRYADGGPPADVPRRSSERLGEVVPDWIVVGEPQVDHLPVEVASQTSVRRGAIIGNGTDVAEADVENPAYAALDNQQARARRRADAVAIQAVGVAHADVFVTRRPYLHALGWDLARGVVVAAPQDALPLVGLYLRTQGEFVVRRGLDGRWTDTFNRGLYYWVGTRELLPSGWRWFSACVQASSEDESIVYLAQSAFQRVQRALEARDNALRALNQEPNNDTAKQALVSLDVVLLELMGAVDATARVAHRALGLPLSERAAAWHRRGPWRKALAAAAPRLAAVTDPGTRGVAVLQILSGLRNSVHGAALNAVGVQAITTRRKRTLVGLPHDDAQVVLRAMDAVGGRRAWSVEEVIADRFHVDPGVLVERVLMETITVLNELMSLTPVEKLANVNLSGHQGPPLDDHVFAEHNRLSIRWQLGL